MASFRRFEDISAWQKARELTRGVYQVSSVGGFSKDFGLRDQLRRASVSVMANISEGFDRGGTREFMQFLSTAKGTAGEIKSHLYVALDQGYIVQTDCERLYETADEIGKMLKGLMTYLRSTPLNSTQRDEVQKVGQLKTVNWKLETLTALLRDLKGPTLNLEL